MGKSSSNSRFFSNPPTAPFIKSPLNAFIHERVDIVWIPEANVGIVTRPFSAHLPYRTIVPGKMDYVLLTFVTPASSTMPDP